MKRTFQQVATAALLCMSGVAGAQSYDLQALLNKGGLMAVDRKVQVSPAKKGAVQFPETIESDGYAIISGLEFSEGVIEVDIRGKDVQGQNFAGIAFHVEPGATAADIVYFRPFNFKSPDPVRRSHSVQYVSPPQWDWSALRETYPDKYESEIPSPPDPNGWFHAKIVVKGDEVTVYVDNATTPCLTVNKLNNRKGGVVALWVGFKTSAEFANLTVSKR